MGGASLAGKTSFYALLSNAYPDYDWLPWKFEQCPRNYWNDIKNVRKFMEWAATQLNVQELSDWYNITYRVFAVKYILSSFK